MSKFVGLREELNKLNIEISDSELERFDKYYDLLIDWNSKMNLTAITEKKEVLYKHFLDSLSPMRYLSISKKKILDLGTGAGFPGMPLAIMNSDANFVLVDSLNKRVNFLNEVTEKLGLLNVECIHARAEDFANTTARESFDFVFSRAVANLSTLSEYCLPFVKLGGFFIPYKSDKSDDEIDSANRAVSLLGGKINKMEEYELGYDNISNRLVFIEKIKHTGKLYPRKAGVPGKQPL